MLRLRRDLAARRNAVHEHVDRVSTLRLGQFAPVRSAGAPPDDSFALEIVSDHVPGIRLSEMLELSSTGRVAIDSEAALHLIRQVLGALAALHESRGVAHGAIGPERLAVTPGGQVMVNDYVLGGALEQLGYPSTRFWIELRIPMATGPGLIRFDEGVDVAQVGMVALALLVGRPLEAEDYPDRLASLIDSLGWRTGRDDDAPLIEAVGDWLRTVLQVGSRRRKLSARQAQVALEAIVTRYRRGRPVGNPLKALLSDHQRARGAGIDARRTPLGDIHQPGFTLARRRTLVIVPQLPEAVPDAPPTDSRAAGAPGRARASAADVARRYEAGHSRR